MDVPKSLMARLEDTARKAATYSYCPYSKFPVGAAVLTDGGEIFSGCNIENASFGLTTCAERIAIFQAVSSGFRRIAAVVLYTSTSSPVSPCGACRQVIQEFGPDARVVSICDRSRRIETTIHSLLPEAFGPQDLDKILHLEDDRGR